MVISQLNRLMSRKSVGEEGFILAFIEFVGTSGTQMKFLAMILMGSLAS